MTQVMPTICIQGIDSNVLEILEILQKLHDLKEIESLLNIWYLILTSLKDNVVMTH
uniref:Nucleic acid binding protein n=1 Tax=Rhizophora mucronata TaxID=61149 RepID=A0A2P2MJB4_RHIMU